MKPIPLIFAILFLSGCEIYRNHLGPEIRLYEGAKREDHEVAIIDQGSTCATCVQMIERIDQTDKILSPIYKLSYEPNFWGDSVGAPNKFKVLPGQYKMTIGVLEGRTGPRWTGYVDLKPGHTYHVLHDNFGQGGIWMEDADTGEVLLGIRT